MGERFRKPVLYPTELWGRGSKIAIFATSCKLSVLKTTKKQSKTGRLPVLCRLFVGFLL